MTLLNNFNNHSNEYIFSDDEFLLNEREKSFKKINSENFEKKNNESLKNLTFSELNSFNYFFQLFDEKPKIIVSEKNVYHIDIVNGVCENFQDENIEIRNISSKDFDKNNYTNDYHHDDIVIDFNKIFLNSGVFLKVKAYSKIKIKINYNTQKNFTVFQQNFYNFQQNSEVKIEENFNLTENTINNIKSDFKVDEYSNIEHNIFQKFTSSNKLFLTSNIACQKKSSFTQFSYNFSEGFVRNFHFAKLNGEFSKAILKGCFFLKDNNTCSNKTHVVHNAENCESNQTYKGVLNDISKASYYSNTIVADKAQKTEGYQLSKGILLTDNCSFFSKPELRIFADDVKCSHGSTIGPVDESALYYLRSRGINKKEAMKMIISSFIEDQIENLDKDNTYIINNNLSNFLNNI